MSEMHASSPRAPRLSCAVAAAVDAVGSSESATETCPAALRSAARSRRKPAGVPGAPSAAQARKRRVASARANWARPSPSYQSENALRSAASATSALSGRCGARIAGAPCVVAGEPGDGDRRPDDEDQREREQHLGQRPRLLREREHAGDDEPAGEQRDDRDQRADRDPGRDRVGDPGPRIQRREAGEGHEQREHGAADPPRAVPLPMPMRQPAQLPFVHGDHAHV